VSACLACAVAQNPLDPIEALGETIPGVPGQDYPIYVQPPETDFSCNDKIQGYYADPDANCQSFHICARNVEGENLIKYSFLCPNGTLFNQQYFICDWWFNLDCSQAEDFYSLNADVVAAGEAALANSQASSSNIVEVSVPAEGATISERRSGKSSEKKSQKTGQRSN